MCFALIIDATMQRPHIPLGGIARYVRPGCKVFEGTSGQHRMPCSHLATSI